MNLAVVDQIAKAVLYEGYMLYPYRPSSVKNKQRWNFGVLYPQSYAEAQSGSDACMSQTECLAAAKQDCKLEVRVRFLQLIVRTTTELNTRTANQQVAEEKQSWQEAEEREEALTLSREELLAGVVHHFTCASAKIEELARDEAGVACSIVIREREMLSGVVEVSAQEHGGLLKLTIRARNTTAFADPLQKDRNEALKRSLLSAHVVLGISGGEFISQLEPPDSARDLAQSCQNIGTWPVLVGNAGERDTMLSSPIILYDYPQIAPESAGDLFDGTEIDEILSLRIMSLTEDEKREIRESDQRARQILERTDTLPPEQLMKLHGVVRSLRPLDKEAS